jgi:arsenite methyltransferase
MKTNAETKQIVIEKYSEIALQNKEANTASCCGSTSCSSEVYNIMSDDYSTIEGYVADADLGLGCGLPTAFAKIKEGDVVVDLGSGAGNDAFVARHETGATGKVFGIDFTPAMLTKARKNAELRGFTNVEFLHGDIESLPLRDGIADVVVSNCVLNLVPDKQKVFAEIFRVLKPGGHFSISDIVLEGDLPPQIREAAEMYAGCVSGAIQKSDYLDIARQSGFLNIAVQKDKPIVIPDDILSNYLSPTEIETFKTSGTSIRSITLYGETPLATECCGSSCCN